MDTYLMNRVMNRNLMAAKQNKNFSEKPFKTLKSIANFMFRIKKKTYSSRWYILTRESYHGDRGNLIKTRTNTI